MSVVRRIDELFYPGYSDAWDEERFRKEVLERIGPSCRLLDYGAGRGRSRAMNFRGFASRVVGVDVDDAVRENAALDEAEVIGSDGRISFPDNAFDVVIASNVVEHLAEPESTFAEIHRVLKGGGCFLLKTTNLQHYVGAGARWTPHSFHRTYNRWRGREASDTFATYYRCNTLRRLKTVARSAGFAEVRIDTWEGRPEYLRLAWPLYCLGLGYERAVNSSDLFRRFRAVLVASMTKN